MKIILHIGWHKTGTSSSLQVFFNRNKQMLLDKYGIYYPEAGSIRNIHHIPAWTLQKPLVSAWAKQINLNKTFNEVFSEMYEETRRTGAESMLISSEEFSQIWHYDLNELRNELSKHKLTIVAYVRRQDDYIESLYMQMLKTSYMHFRSDLKKFANDKIQAHHLDYNSYFNTWKSIFNESKFIIKIYDTKQFFNNDIRHDFLNSLGLTDTQGLVFDEKVKNESLGFFALEFLKRMKKINFTDNQYYKMIGEIVEYENKHGKIFSSQLTKEDRAWIMEAFKEANQLFESNHLNNQSRFGDEIYEPEQKAEFTDKIFNEMLLLVIPKILGNE